MHVLVTADTVGGVWTYTRELVSGLARRGVRVTLVSFGKIPRPAQTQWLDRLQNVDFRPTAFRLEWMQDAANDVAASTDYLQTIIEDVKPELLHLNQYCYGGVRASVPRIVVAHSDVVSWSVAVHGSEPEPDLWTNWYRGVVSEGLASATQVVAISEVVRENLRQHFAVKNARVIYNGRSTSLFDSTQPKQRAVLAVGRVWDEAKNLALLLEAQPDAPVWIAGNSEDPGSGSTAALRSMRQIEFKGELTEPELRRLYARAGVYAATSQYEPFGLAPLEAALSRCAIVANDIPTFHELWRDAVLYFRHNDARSLREQLERLLDDHELRQHYGELAYQRGTEMFTSDRMVEDYLLLYDALIEQHRSRPARAQVAKGAELVS
jgi:glycogen(starch) synthase